MNMAKKYWKIDLKKMRCRNPEIGIEISFVVTNENELFGIITRTESGLHQYIAGSGCDLNCIHDQFINVARYYFARKYYKRDNPYKRIPDMPGEACPIRRHNLGLE
jgi:hypothetical protein